MCRGAEYCAETTRSWTPGKYNAPKKISGFAGSLVAIESSLAASSAADNCFARAADFDSCARAVAETVNASAPASQTRTTPDIGPPPAASRRDLGMVLSPGGCRAQGAK